MMFQQKVKVRNRIAIDAWNRSGAGTHKDRKKEQNKRKCRDKVREEE